MARERSEMRRVKEVLRLRLAFGLSHKAISAACRMPRTTVRDYCERAKAAGIDSFAAVEPLSERALEARLFKTGIDRDAPDEAVLHGSRQRAQCPQPRLGSGDADGVRASQLQHAVEDKDRHVHLSCPTLVRARAQTV